MSLDGYGWSGIFEVFWGSLCWFLVVFLVGFLSDDHFFLIFVGDVSYFSNALARWVPEFFGPRCWLLDWTEPSTLMESPINQWLFLVPLKGGIGGIVHPPIGRKYTTYIPLIVLAFFWGWNMLPIPPFRGTRNNHWIKEAREQTRQGLETIRLIRSNNFNS